jgi:galactokinase/mevalonate kinase-like predicted kinase
MVPGNVGLQHLLTLPPRMAGAFESLERRHRPGWFASSDPEDRSLGSGGGTANLLAEAWRATGRGMSFNNWLQTSRKLILHAGGQSRRLPAYAATGKALMPLPVFRWGRGQRLDQTLLDVQLPDYQRVLEHAPSRSVAMITSGDVLLRFSRDLPPFPDVDVLGLGMWLAPERASGFGVFCAPRQRPADLAFFLQKPSAEQIRSLAGEYLCLVDTGMWLLSERAVNVLMKRCGWNAAQGRFVGDRCGFYELYADFGLGLGSQPTKRDPAVNALSCAVLPLPDARFFHFGTSAQMIESVAELQTLVLDEAKLGHAGARELPDLVTQNSRFQAGLSRENRMLWVESSVVGAGWEIRSEHVLTGIPENNWRVQLPAGACLDFVPVGESAFCVRPYGFHDRFSGALGDAGTKWFGRPALEWLESRGISPEAAALDGRLDIQESALFPLISAKQLDGKFVQWLVDSQPDARFRLAESWVKAERLSARQLAARINLKRLYAHRDRLRSECLVPMWENFRSSVFFRLDLESTGRIFATTGKAPPQARFAEQDDPMQIVHDRMFRSAVLRHRKKPAWASFEAEAFAELRRAIVREAQLAPAMPRRNVQEDQIVWARSPVRLDLAGGWTDTPPYCLENGGRVLNVAVDLNGQPPIQVFAKLCDKPELVIRSIDLGLEERVRTFAELDRFAQPGSPFALPKAALALAGFLPRFHATGESKTLKDQLRAFGGGIELSLLSAVPKGSGLGTSSILAATVLAAIGDLSGLGWDRNVLFTRTLALEQMLTTGGGWQDQAGAIFRGIKLIETGAGLSQKPTLRWLPPHLLDRDYANRSVLLYYTGITRLAKNILAEIVRGLFLNSPSHLRLIQQIGENAGFAAEAIQKCDYDLLTEAIRNSWSLNQRLDAGTNPPAVQTILDRVSDYIAAVKLLGAGGGGYLLMFAKDEDAAARLRLELTQNPSNPRARFVDFTVSEAGLQLTRS